MKVSLTRFYYAKNIRPTDIHGWLLKCVVRVQWTMGFRGSGIGCSKVARQICMTRNELGARNSSSGKVSSILRTLPNLHHVLFTCLSISRICWPATVGGVTKRQNTLCRSGWEAWRWPFFFRRGLIKGCPTVKMP